MRASKLFTAAAVAAALLLMASRAHATEICGNSIDDDNNGLTDEGCYPSLTTGVCESPLSCADTGMVSWTTGSLHYDVPPDFAPAVPYGPGIGFRRFYTPQYTPSGAQPTTVNHTPMGPGWQHTYMTWLYAFNDGTTNRIVVHTSQGRDVYYTDAGACGSYECYTPQAGDHVLKLYVDTAKSYYYIQLLTGETLVYNNYGQIVEIWDTLPTPNVVSITWTGTSNGNVSTVTDASGMRRLSFNYTNNLLTSIDYQLKVAGTFTTEVTASYDYSNYVTRDASSGWFMPANATEWTNLLQGTGISNPTNLWGCQESSGNLADSIGSATLTKSGTSITYQQSVSGWSRKSVKIADNTTSGFASPTSLCNPATSACSALGVILVAATAPASNRDIMVMGDANGARGISYPTGLPTHPAPRVEWNGSNIASSSGNIGGAVGLYLLTASSTAHNVTFYTGSSGISPTWATGTSTHGYFSIGGAADTSAAAQYLYLTEWAGTALTSAQRTTVFNRMQNGPGILTKVTMGSTLVAQHTYTNGYLTQVSDGGGTQVASFAYSSTNSGEVDLISTSRGTVGFEYGSSRTGCTGNTILYFNQGNSSSCSADSDCGTGYLCGGKTGTGSTGKCFLAGRCMTTSTVNGESVVTNIAPLGPGGGSCSGACTDVMQYLWTVSGSGNVNVTGRKDPLANYTSIIYNSNGLPTQIGYGDSDGDPTNGGTNRTVYMFYDTTFPGRLAEIRRASDLSSSASSCSASNTTGCERTQYCYGSSCSSSCQADNQLCTIEQDGFTLDASGTVQPFAYKTTYIHNESSPSETNGRLREIDGPVTGMITKFNYNNPDGNPFTDNFLHDYQVYTDGTHYLQPQLTTYDFWGHPTSLKAPDGNFTCDTYDSSLGYLVSRRRAMAGQTDCSTPNGSDLTTSWVRDSWKRLTQLTRPDASCVLYSYDGLGRLYQVKRRDDCNGASSGDTQQYSYTADSQVSEIDTYNAGGTLTAKRPYTYFASRRLQEVVNPVDTSKFTGLVYDSAGKETEIDGAASLAKTVFHFDGVPGRDGRVSSEERFKTGSASDTWSLLYAWMGDQTQVTDGDSKVTSSSRDDLGRLVKLSSPDLSGPTVNVYDAASRVTTTVEVLGGGANQQTHSFTYDFLGRRLNDDFQGRCSAHGGTNHPWIQRTYDTTASCPGGMTYACTNQGGRLAYVETVLMCSSDADGSLDQVTYYAYDADGRAIEEYITDDTGRVANNLFTYSSNGVLSQVTTPSGAIINWVYGSSGSNSDADRVTLMSRGTPPGTTVIDTVQWYPFGPWQQYNWEASIGGTTLKNSVDRNLAYRVTAVHGALQGSTENAKVAISEDAMGRVTSRVYTPHDPTLSGLFDSYFTYDEQSHVVCESTASGTCPTSGSTLKNNHDQSDPFRPAGDWKEILRPIPGSSGGTINNFNSTGTGYGTSHQVTDVNQSNGTPAFGHTAMAYDARGLRSYDDNTTTLTNDRRDYTYDARRNLVNVRGQYYTGGAWHYYDVASAFDHKNRRVFKSFYDESTLKTAQWFFYYDNLDRLTEVRSTPDTSVPGTYSTFQLFWLQDKLVLYWQTDTPSGAVSKRYVASDETDRPIQLWNWPSTGDATRVWAINPSAWGADTTVLGSGVFQPTLFAGQYEDVETVALENGGATVHRQGLTLNGHRTYDPFTGSYVQFDPLANQTWSPYVYAGTNPVGSSDPTGLLRKDTQYTGTKRMNVCGDLNPGLDPAMMFPPGGSWSSDLGQPSNLGYMDNSGDNHYSRPYGPGNVPSTDWNTDWDWDCNSQGPGQPTTPPDSPQSYPNTFPGDVTGPGHGCSPAAGYDANECGLCVNQCAQSTGTEGCLSGACSPDELDSLNNCKINQCEVATRFCAVTCGFQPTPTDPRRGPPVVTGLTNR